MYILFRPVGFIKEFQKKSGTKNSFHFTDARAVGSSPVGWTDKRCWAEWKGGTGNGQRTRRKGAAARGACARTESILLVSNSSWFYTRVTNRQNEVRTLCRALSKQFLSQPRFCAPSHGHLVGTHACASCSLFRNPVTWALSHQECLDPAASAPTGLKPHLV